MAVVAAVVGCAGFAPASSAGQGPGEWPLRFGADLAHSRPAPAGTPAATAATAGASKRSTGPVRRPSTKGGQTATAGGSGLVTSSGTSLMLNGSVWQFTGYDDYRLPSTYPGWQCGGTMTDADVARAMDEMKTHSGATVVRTWFMQAYGGPGNWSQFDRVLSAASARGIKIIPVLVDQGASCEPWPIGVPHYRTLAWYQSGYTRPDYGYALSYRDYAAAIAKHYAGNTTIAFWQLVNEAEALTSAGGSCDEQAANHALRSFADDVAGVVKANDPSHLVSLGTIGGGQCGAAGSADYRYLHAGLIDLCEYHEYWGESAVPGDQWNGVATRINDCHALNKPIFAGEVGIDASIQPDGTNSGIVTKASLALRAQYLQSKMKAQFPMGLVGFLVWDYDNGPSKYYEVGPGDPTEAVMAQVAATLPGAGP